jgi:hypothetical protein
MKLPHKLISVFYLILIVSGSWYFGDYSKRELTSQESYSYFKQSVAKAEKGMKERDRKQYNKTAGVSDNKGL